MNVRDNVRAFSNKVGKTRKVRFNFFGGSLDSAEAGNKIVSGDSIKRLLGGSPSGLYDAPNAILKLSTGDHYAALEKKYTLRNYD